MGSKISSPIFSLLTFFSIISSPLLGNEDEKACNTCYDKEFQLLDVTVFQTKWGMFFFEWENVIYQIEEMVHSDTCPCVRWKFPIPHYSPACNYSDQLSCKTDAKVWKILNTEGFYLECTHGWFTTLYSTARTKKN